MYTMADNTLKGFAFPFEVLPHKGFGDKGYSLSTEKEPKLSLSGSIYVSVDGGVRGREYCVGVVTVSI